MSEIEANVTVSRFWQTLDHWPGFLPLVGAWALVFSLGENGPEYWHVVASVAFAFITYFVTQPCENIFDCWYSLDDRKKHTFCQRLGTRLNNPAGLILPSGKDIKQHRDAAIELLWKEPGTEYYGQGIYRISKDAVRAYNEAEWRRIYVYSALNKLSRGLVGIGLAATALCLLVLAFRRQIAESEILGGLTRFHDTDVLIALFVALLFSFACFVGFVRAKSEHMIELYKKAVAISGTEDPTKGFRERGLDADPMAR